MGSRQPGSPDDRRRSALRARQRVHARRQPAHGDRRADGGARGRRGQAGPARDHRLGQDLHDRQRHLQSSAADADLGPQQDPGRAALRRVQGPVPEQRRRVLRVLLRLLPARGLHRVQRHLHREGRDHQRRRSTGCGTSATYAACSRAQRDVIIIASVSCIYGLGSGRGVLRPAHDRVDRRRRCAWSATVLLRKLVAIQYKRNDVRLPPRHVPRARGDVVDVFPAYEERLRRSGSSSSATRSTAIYEFDPLRGNVVVRAR